MASGFKQTSRGDAVRRTRSRGPKQNERQIKKEGQKGGGEDSPETVGHTVGLRKRD